MATEDLLEEVNLRYSTDKKAGFTRKVIGKKFYYYDLEGRKITEKKVIERINKLVIPPAYTNVWICPYTNGHLQATGYDKKRRKQYRYHPLWIEISQEEKFSHLLDFAKSLPKIRKCVARDMNLKGLPREKVIATVIWLLENTLIRVGNDEYKNENESFGLTTIGNDHVDVKGSTMKFRFKGKSGVPHDVKISDRKVANIVRRCMGLPGQDLFAYEDSDGISRDITSQDINNYLKNITGKDISAKDFRTWGGTIITASLLDEIGIDKDDKISKKNLVEAVKKVSHHLRNKPSTCRKYYIHPSILDAYTDGQTLSHFKENKSTREFRKISGLDASENSVLRMLSSMVSEMKNSIQAKSAK